MNHRNGILLGGSLAAAVAAGALGVATVRAQEGGDPPAKATPGVPVPAEDPGALVKALGDGDFAVREKAFGRLREAGAAARKALEEGSRSDDAQIRWSSKRLLRLLDEPSHAARRKTLEFDMEDGEKDEGRGDRDPFEALGGEALRKHMAEIRERMRELEREFQDLPVRMPRFEISGNALLPGAERHVVVERDGNRTEARVDADGRVKVTLTRTEDGKPKEETFEAPSLEALEKEHPEVYGKVKDLLGEGGRFRVFSTIPSVPGTPRLEFRDAGRRLRGLFRDEPAGSKPILGVMVTEAPAVLRTQLSLSPEEGVVVEEVLEGTPAARIGLQRHDVLLAVNGIPVSSVEDVRSAVAAVKEGGEIRLRILRVGQRTDLAGVR